MLSKTDLERYILGSVSVIVDEPLYALVGSGTLQVEGSTRRDYSIDAQQRHQRGKLALILKHLIRPYERHVHEGAINLRSRILSSTPMFSSI